MELKRIGRGFANQSLPRKESNMFIDIPYRITPNGCAIITNASKLPPHMVGNSIMCSSGVNLHKLQKDGLLRISKFPFKDASPVDAMVDSKFFMTIKTKGQTFPSCHTAFRDAICELFEITRSPNDQYTIMKYMALSSAEYRVYVGESPLTVPLPTKK